MNAGKTSTGHKSTRNRLSVKFVRCQQTKWNICNLHIRCFYPLVSASSSSILSFSFFATQKHFCGFSCAVYSMEVFGYPFIWWLVFGSVSRVVQVTSTSNEGDAILLFQPKTHNSNDVWKIFSDGCGRGPSERRCGMLWHNSRQQYCDAVDSGSTTFVNHFRFCNHCFGGQITCWFPFFFSPRSSIGVVAMNWMRAATIVAAVVIATPIGTLPSTAAIGSPTENNTIIVIYSEFGTERWHWTKKCGGGWYVVVRASAAKQ